jgi:hypothetical protein
MALLLTRRATTSGPPLDEDALLAEAGAQVKGLGGTAINRILAAYGIDRPVPPKAVEPAAARPRRRAPAVRG